MAFCERQIPTESRSVDRKAQGYGQGPDYKWPERTPGHDEHTLYVCGKWLENSKNL